eukprot:TRINITY_DN2934_c0_g2_i3.p1 TRINITY_DN2934_c0_g2~~TRINITY_DN2934_c0_g2_i3.p1  ORF type:complete len:303 (+),score=96.77 TRINITY_DN2934_c0_g2_i3:51-911(+)
MSFGQPLGMGMGQPGMQQQQPLGMGMNQPGMQQQQQPLGMGMGQPGMQQQQPLGMGMMGQQGMQQQHQHGMQMGMNQQSGMQQQGMPIGGSMMGGFQIPGFQSQFDMQQFWNQRYGAVPQQRQMMLQQKFQQLDIDRTGMITATELCQAFSQPSMPFKMDTARILVRCFDQSGEGNISIDEFMMMDQFLERVRGVWMQFGQDNYVQMNELPNALSQLQFQISPGIIQNIARILDVTGGQCALNYERFMECCSMLQLLQTLFQRFGGNRGSVNLNFEQLVGIGLYLK